MRGLAVISIAGGLVGAGLLLALPGASFERVVPYLIVVACALVIAQPRLSARMRRRQAGDRAAFAASRSTSGMFATAVYGGYFGAAQGVIFIALLSIFIDDHLQRLNAAKNVVAALVNGVAAVLFMLFAPVAWLPAGLLAAGSAIGGQIGARVGRRLPPTLLRLLIVVAGLAVAIKLSSRPDVGGPSGLAAHQHRTSATATITVAATMMNVVISAWKISATTSPATNPEPNNPAPARTRRIIEPRLRLPMTLRSFMVPAPFDRSRRDQPVITGSHGTPGWPGRG